MLEYEQDAGCVVDEGILYLALGQSRGNILGEGGARGLVRLEGK